MSWKRKCLKRARLYLILDRHVNSYENLWRILTKSVPCGVDIVQLRDKFGCARDILKFAKEANNFLAGKVPFIVNDRVDLSILSCSSGVHLGQEDIPLPFARRMMGPNAIIGVSCQTLKHALQAQKDGADYIGFGSVFKTQTKPDRQPMNLKLLKEVTTRIKIPVFAIGGIERKNIQQIRLSGANRVAVCREICLAKDIKSVVLDLKEALHSI